MSIFDENNYIQITKEDISDALQSSNHLDSRIQKRAFANVLGARLGIKLLNTLEIKANNFNSIYTIPAILKDMDISDIRTNNNVTVDIRVVQDENHLCIPKAQYDYNVTPDIYIFVRITPDMSAAVFVGAIAPDEIDKSIELDGYYFISKDTLYNEISLKKAINTGKPESNLHPSENEIVRAQSMLVNFIDGDVISSEKHYLYEILKNSDELRKFFRDFEQFELISTDLAHTDEILSDSVLDVLGAQEIYKNETYNGSFASEIDLDELAVETAADFVEDFIEDSKEDEMPNNNDILEGEFKELPDEAPVEEPGELEQLPSDEELASFADNIQSYTESDDLLEPVEDLISTQSEFEGFEGLDTTTIDESNITESTDNLEEFNQNTLDLDTTNDDNLSNFAEFTELQPTNDIVQDNDDVDITDADNISSFESFEDIQENQPADTIYENNNFEEFEAAEAETTQDIAISEELNEIDFDSQEDINTDNILSEDEFKLEELTPQQIDLGQIDIDGTEDYTNQATPEENLVPENTINPTPDNEILEISGQPEIGTIDDLESFELPVDMDLPHLEYDENLDKLGENPQIEQINETPEDNNELKEIPQTLDDISQNVTFNEQGNIEELNQITDEPETEQLIIEDNTQNTIDENSSALSNEDDDMSGLEEFTVDMAEAYEQANPQVFNTNSGNIDIDINDNVPNQDVLSYNEADFSLTDELPKLDNLEQLEPLEQSLEPLENNIEENNKLEKNDIPALETYQEDISTPESTSDDMQVLPELDNLYGTPDLNSNIGEEFNSQMEVLNEDIVSSQEHENFTQDTSSPQDFSNSGFTEMEVYRPEADNNINEFETSAQQETFNFDATQDNEVLSFDNLNTQQNAVSESAYSDINLDDLDADDDEFGDFNSTNDNNYTDVSDIDVDNINIDDIDINNIDINNIDINNIDINNMDINNMDMSEFDVNNLSSIENIPDVSQSSPEVEFVQNEVTQEEYVPDFNQNDENTINSLYEENTQNQNPGDAIDQSFDQNNVNPQSQKQKKSKGQQKTSPLLGILLIALLVAFGFMKKDLILEKFNAQKGVSYEQDQNMPVEGETQEDREDAKLLNDDNNPQDENQGQEQMPVGEIPGEAGGPQDAASMEQSLHQKGSMANDIPGVKEQLPSSTPVPITTNTIKRLYWEIPQDLTYNDSIVNYLKTVGKTMKFAIQSDLLNITEMPYSNKMIVEIEIKKDGSVGDVNTTVSSGSKQIDTIVLQSVKAAIKYVKAPTSEFKSDSNRFSLIINF